MIYSQPVYLTRTPNLELSIATVKPYGFTKKGGITHRYQEDDKRKNFFPFRRGEYDPDKPRFAVRRKYFGDLQPGDTIPSIMFIWISNNKKDFNKIDFENRDYRSERSLHFPCYCIGRNGSRWSYRNDIDMQYDRWLSVTKNVNMLKQEKGKETWLLQAYPEGIERKGLPIRRTASTPLHTLPLYQGLVNNHMIRANKLNHAMISIIYNEDLKNYISTLGAHTDMMINHKTRRIKNGD